MQEKKETYNRYAASIDEQQGTRTNQLLWAQPYPFSFPYPTTIPLPIPIPIPIASPTVVLTITDPLPPGSTPVCVHDRVGGEDQQLSDVRIYKENSFGGERLLKAARQRGQKYYGIRELV